MSRDVFISYRHEDQTVASRVCSALERQSISCWIAPRDISPGEEWASGIVAGIQRCHTFVLILSAHCQHSRQIARELELADKGNLRIIAFRIDDIQPPPDLLYFLGNVQWVDAFENQFDSSLARLAAAITASDGYPAVVTRHVLKARSSPLRPQPSEPSVCSAIPSHGTVLKAALGVLLAVGLCAGAFLKIRHIQASDDFDEGEKYFRMGELKSALSEFTGALQADPKFYNAYCERAQVYRELKDNTAALADLEHAIQLDPRRARALTLKDRLLEATSREGQPHALRSAQSDAAKLNSKPSKAALEQVAER